MANAKVTKKDVLTKALGMEFTDEEKTVIQKMIDGLEKRSSKPTKAQVANEGIKAKIVEVLTTTPQTAKAIADAVGESVNRVAALLKQIDGVIVTPGAKSKDPKTYSIGEVVDEGEVEE